MSGKLIMGVRSYCNGSIQGDKNDVFVGKYCSIAENVIFDCGLNHNSQNITTFPFNTIYPEKYSQYNTHPVTKGDIIIGNDVWIGRDTTIMSGVTIGDGAIIGTKSLVTKDVAPYTVVGGVPARFIKNRFEDENVKNLIQESKWWDLSESEVNSLVSYLMSSDVKGFTNQLSANKKNKYKGLRVAYYTRSINQDLYDKMKGLIGETNIQFVNVSDLYNEGDVLKYICDIIQDERYDWVINIEEDLFVYNEDNILNLLDYMVENDFDYCGIPDGGACVLRYHSPIAMNPFFNIFNTGKIRKIFNLDKINSFRYNKNMEKSIPVAFLKENHAWRNDYHETYYSFYYWLTTTNLKPLYLRSYDIDDGNVNDNASPNKTLSGISTVIKNHVDEEIGIHTWYSNLYNKDEFHTVRINNAFELAKSKKVIVDDKIIDISKDDTEVIVALPEKDYSGTIEYTEPITKPKYKKKK